MEVFMSQQPISPVHLDESQVEQAAQLLARVFQHAPDMTYLVGDDEKMLTRPVLRFYEAVIRIGLLSGEVYTTPSMDSLAIWTSPENNQFTFTMMLQSGLLKAILSMGLGPAVRFFRSSNYLEKFHKEAISRPHWILVFLGVEPSQQGKGIGGELIQPVLTRADAEGVPCYVESADERNHSFYKRHGFQIVRQSQVPQGAPMVWIFVREPSVRRKR
jgi:GNAT superfamily N-acetyltransferase